MTLHKKWIRQLVGSMLILLAISGCTPTSPATRSGEAASTPDSRSNRPPIVLTISGSGGTSAVLSAVRTAFEAATPGYSLEILPGTETSGGVQGAITGVLDAAAMARAPKDEETAQKLTYVEFGKAGVAVWTHPDVDVVQLRSEQVSAIFSGAISNWSAVGGQDLPIVVYVRNEQESSTQALRKHVFGETPFPPTVSAILTSQNDMQAAVAGTPGSVGFGSWPAAQARGAEVRAIALDGVTPGDPAYPLLLPVGLGFLEQRSTDVQPLIDWLRSEAGRTALRGFDVVVTP